MLNKLIKCDICFLTNLQVHRKPQPVLYPAANVQLISNEYKIQPDGTDISLKFL